VTCSAYQDKLIVNNVIVPFLLLSVVIVALPCKIFSLTLVLLRKQQSGIILQ